MNGDSVVFNWNRGTDAETHAKALCYNLIIGTTSYGYDVMSPYNAVGGTCMKISKRGNEGNDTTWHIKGLEPGTYYWSVSSVDNGFYVSTQSTDGTFVVEKTNSINDNFLNQSIKIFPNPVNAT